MICVAMARGGHTKRQKPAGRWRVPGFSLIELLVVIAVLAILAVAAFPLAEVTVQRERERELKRTLWEIRDAIDAYKKASDVGLMPKAQGGSGYPPNLAALVQGAPNAKAAGLTMFFLRRVPRDPFADDALPAEATWGLRSYQSTPDQPKAGDDVYDVYSMSTKSGLNGVPLKQW
jgi:general secretion pathway protein G